MVYRDDLPLIQQQINKNADTWQKLGSDRREAARQQDQQAATLEHEKLKSYLTGQQADVTQERNLAGMQKIQDSGMFPEGASVKVGDVSIGKDPMAVPVKLAQQNALTDRQNARNAKAQQDLSKRYEKYGSLNAALSDVESLTNRDMKGGALTNPDAELKSMGKYASKVPSVGIGLAELISDKYKGASEERGAINNVLAQWQKSISGQAITEQESARLREIKGQLASGDPKLVNKGLRSIARDLKNSYQTIQSGFQPDVREAYHAGPMQDPLKGLYGRIYEDNAPGSVAPKAPPTAPGAPPADGFNPDWLK